MICSEEYRNYAIKHVLITWLLNTEIRKFSHHTTFYSLLTLNAVPPSNVKSNIIYTIQYNTIVLRVKLEIFNTLRAGDADLGF